MTNTDKVLKNNVPLCMSDNSTRPREDAVKFIKTLMINYEKPNSEKWHFGYCELRELLDFIYCGEPKNEKEMLRNHNE